MCPQCEADARFFAVFNFKFDIHVRKHFTLNAYKCSTYKSFHRINRPFKFFFQLFLHCDHDFAYEVVFCLTDFLFTLLFPTLIMKPNQAIDDLNLTFNN